MLPCVHVSAGTNFNNAHLAIPTAFSEFVPLLA